MKNKEAHAEVPNWVTKSHTKYTELRASINMNKLIIKGKLYAHFVNKFGKNSGE